MKNNEHGTIILFEIVISVTVAFAFIIFFGTAGSLAAKVESWTAAAQDESDAAYSKSAFKKSFAVLVEEIAHAGSIETISGVNVSPIKKTIAVFEENSITAESAVVVDYNTGEVLLSKKMDKRWPLASITKLVTASIILDMSEKDGTERAALSLVEGDIREGKNFINSGEAISLDDGIKAMLVGSSNTLAVALVRSSNIDKDEWQSKVNEKLVEWNLQKTQIREPSGLSPGNVSTAFETAEIFKNAFAYKKISSALGESVMALNVSSNGKNIKRQVENTNWFLLGNIKTDFNPAPLTKTGHIEEAKYNLVGRFEKDGHSVIVAVLGSADSFTRFTEANKLAEWVFNNYSWGLRNTLIGG